MIKYRYLQSHKKIAAMTLAFFLAACGNSANGPANSLDADRDGDGAVKPAQVTPAKKYTLSDIEHILADPVKRSEMIVKVMGSTAREDTYAFLKFHVYGYAGENIIPFFTMNNVIVQKWFPKEPGHYDLRHYEVAYYSEFDTEKPIEKWENPVTGEVVDIPHFILGPIERQYTPDGIIAPGIAPNPLNISVIGNRVFIPTQSTDKVFNPMSTPEWGEYAGSPDVYWDSMLTYSADIEDVLDPEKSMAGAEIHMQNLVSWNAFFKMGYRPGRTMVRAFGTHLDSLDDLPPEARAGLEKYTPEIFNTDEWEDVRIDAIEYMVEIQEKIARGEIDVSPVEEN